MAPATEVQEKVTDPAVTLLPPAGDEIEGAVVGHASLAANFACAEATDLHPSALARTNQIYVLGFRSTEADVPVDVATTLKLVPSVESSTSYEVAPPTDVQEKVTDPAVTVLPSAGDEIDGAAVGQPS
ncbi:MAG TPA: hypothetical protein VMS98_07175 [Thermoanaerobaculia bacterium]|nr:hypothetical protein [Thermoanaerobaculia bacterium]